MNKPRSFIIWKIISYSFIPPMMNLLIFTIFSLNFENGYNSFYSILISFLFGVLFPIITFLILRNKGKIINNEATVKEERTIPYIYGIGFSLCGVIISSLLSLHEALIMLWMVYLISSIVIVNVNHYWKISAHTMGAAIPLGALMLYPNSTLLIIISLILVLVGISRINLKVHTLSQVISGALVGFLISVVLLNYCL